LCDAVHHQNLAQGLALKALAGRNRFIGPTLSISPVRPASSNPQDVAAAKLHDMIFHRAFLDPLLGYGYPEPLAFRMAPLVRPGDLEVIAHRPDFLGLNYYGPEYRQAWTGAPFSNDGNVSPPREPITSEKTRIDPQGLFLRSQLLAAQKALAAGCNLRGYFVWSFLDCWEWTWGYDQRFGLVHVDFDTGVRIPKSSFSWYRSVLGSNKIRP
jgi:beta-glucosidase